VQESLDKLMEGKTTITVAHRIQTIENSDVINVMDNGKIVEFGSYRQLI
jgi:ABC-type multidrug transport system fused ATPase/permease subunit